MSLRMRLQPEAIGSGMTSQRVRDRLVDRLRGGAAGGEAISDERVLNAIRTVPRHLFVDEALATRAYEVLEIGTGSGYQAAILAALGLEVHTVERIGELLRTARKRFRQLGMNIRSKHDDGRIGWPENGPFDAIIVTAAAPALVDALGEQLAPEGVLVAPVGGATSQSLLVLHKAADGTLSQRMLGPVVFVPLLSGMVD